MPPDGQQATSSYHAGVTGLVVREHAVNVQVPAVDRPATGLRGDVRHSPIQVGVIGQPRVVADRASVARASPRP